MREDWLCRTCGERWPQQPARHPVERCVRNLQDALAQAQQARAELEHQRNQACILLQEVREQLQQAQAALEAIRMAIPFSSEWAVEHQRDDHMVTLDHKDEMDLAEFVLAVYAALQARPG